VKNLFIELNGRSQPIGNNSVSGVRRDEPLRFPLALFVISTSVAFFVAFLMWVYARL
jgi:hypothetical protein